MPAGLTYEALATTSLSGGTTYTFSGWTGSYTDYVVVGSCIMSGSTTIRLRLNGATSGYYYQITRNDGTVGAGSNAGSLELCDNAGVSKSTFIANIMNADASTLVNKCVIGYGSGSSLSQLLGGGLTTSNTISSITVLTTNGATFASSSTLTLFGIARA